MSGDTPTRQLPVKPSVADAAAAGVERYTPKPAAVDLSEFGGGKKERLANAGPDRDLIPDFADVLSKEELLNTEQAMRLYNEGMNAEQFLQTPVGKALSKYAQQDQDEFQIMALDKADLSDPEVQKSFKRACAAAYFHKWLEETLAKSVQAAQALRLQDESDQEE